MNINRNRSWLFAFSDLAFLLLISLSLVPTAPENITVRLIDIPEVPESQSTSKPSPKLNEDVWQLEVHPVSKKHPKPFKLVWSGNGIKGSKEPDSKYLDKDELKEELLLAKETENRAVPALLPEKQSISQDFLFAAGAIGLVWNPDGKNRAFVKVEKPPAEKNK